MSGDIVVVAFEMVFGNVARLQHRLGDEIAGSHPRL